MMSHIYSPSTHSDTTEHRDSHTLASGLQPPPDGFDPSPDQVKLFGHLVSQQEESEMGRSSEEVMEAGGGPVKLEEYVKPMNPFVWRLMITTL